MKIIKEGRQRNYSEIFVFILLCLSIFCLILYIFYPAKFPITGGIVSDGVSEILPENQENSENLTASISFVIELKNAEHLDFNKNLVSNLYEQIKGLDGVWSEEIYDGEHIRIIFEEKLTNKKDITIYPEVLSGNPIMEVYEKDKSDLLAVFTNLTSNKYNRILLTNLQGEQDSFDLKVSGGTLRIEHIYDPTVSNLYDFSTGSGSDKWAFTFANLDAATGPPYTESSLAPAGEITTAVTTTNLQTYNQQFITIAGTVGDYSPLYLKFTITEDPTTITNISIDVQGIYTQTSGTAMQVWAYNFSNPGYYVQIEGDLAITSTASPGLNFSRYINNGYSDFINGSGTMFILFVDGTANIDEYFDYVRLNVTYTQDTTPPYFTSIPANASLFYGNQSLSVDFDATDEGTFGYFAINDTRFSITQAGILTNATPLAVGNYEINVTINDSSNNINWTRYKVQINKSNYYDCGVYFNVSSPQTYPENFSVFTNCSSDYTLYRNGSSINNNTFVRAGAGYYNLTVIRTDTANYTNIFDDEFFTINKNPNDKCQVFYNTTSGIIHPDIYLAWHNCTTAATLKRNDTTISNNSVQNSGWGAYNFSLFRTDSQNYSYIYNESQFIVNKNTADICGVYFNASSGINYPNLFRVYTNCSSSYNLHRNGSLILNATTINSGAGYYNLTVQRTDASNYTNTFMSQFFTVNNGTLTGTLASTKGWTYVYDGTSTIISYSESNNGDTDVVYKVWRDNSDKGSGETVNLAVGGYSYKLNSTGGANYSSIASINAQTLTINQNTTDRCQIFYNTTSPVTYPKTFRVWANCTTAFVLARNGTTIVNNSEQVLAVSAYNFSMSRNDTVNYSYIYNESQFIVTEILDEEAPYFTSIPANASLFYGNQSLSVDFDATDAVEFSMIFINDTRFIMINSTGILTNATPLAVGNYEINVTINDSSNNINWTRYKVQINKSLNYDCGIYFNATSPLTYPDLFIVYTNCSSTYTLYRNGSSISNGSTINSGAGYYNLTVQRIDASNYTNTFMSQFFTVNNGTLTGTLASTKGWTYVYDGTSTIISYSESNNGDTDVVYKVWKDNSDKSSGETVNLAVGGYSYKLNSTGGANYSSIASINAQTLTINQNTTDRCQIFYNTTSPLYYPNTFKVWHNCTTAVTLYKNGTIITNNTEQVLAVSAYNFSFLRTDTANYSYIYNESQFRITEAPDTTPPYFTSIPANSSLFYGNQSLSVDFDATDAVEFSMIFINDTRFIMINSTGVLTNATPLAVGNYEINVTINDSSNNINWTRYKVQINKSLNYDCGVYFNASSGINYPDLFIIYTNCSSTYTLYRNGSSISNGSTINSGAGYYNLTVQRTDATNYTNTVNSQFFTVNKDTANKCQIFYNETSPLIYPATFKVWANCTTGFTLKRNDSGIGNNTEQVLAIGAYNFSFLRTDIQNYSYVYNESEFRITPDMTPPTINITKPENKTYMKETNLQLRFAASNYETLSYQIDNGANITLSGNTTFDTTDGQHTLYIFANNSYGIDSENVIFTVNSTRFFINYSNYKEQGVSTDFNSSSFEDLENLPGVILEIPSYGKIVFNENINLTNDETPLDNFLDIDSNSNISSNFVEINSTALPNFNKSATIYLYGLTFSDPRILRDGVVCDSPICTEVNYSGGTFIFNVSSFTYYSAEETPVSSAVITPSGGGGDAPVIEQLEYECTSNLNCSQDEACLNGQCVKLFDVKIIEFNSPVKLGEFFEFIYFIKGMANISGDVTIDFWIEKNGEKVTSGSDVIYFGEFEEKTEKTKIFLPKSVESGVYQFFVQASFGSYVVKSHRTIEIEVKDGIATLEPREAKRMNLLIPLIAIVLLLSALFVGLRVQRYINEKRRREFDRIVNLFEKNIEKNLLKRSQQKIQEKKSYQLEARKESVQPVKQEPEEWIEKAVKETERRNKTRRTGEQLINEIKIDEVISETERKNKGRKTAEQLIDELNKISVRKEKEEEQIESAIKETERRNKTRKTAEQLIDELKKRDFF